MREEDLEDLKKQLNFYKYVLLIFWGFIFLVFYLFRTSGNIISTPLSDLSSIGSFFNIVTSLTGIITVFLLAKAIIFQKQELTAIQEQMKTQKESLENEEKINRTIKMIDELEVIISGDKDSNAFIEKTIFLSNSEIYEMKIDFPVLRKAILRHNSILLKMKTKKEKSQSEFNTCSKRSKQLENTIIDSTEKINSLEEEKEKLTTTMEIENTRPLTSKERLDIAFELNSAPKLSETQNEYENLVTHTVELKSIIAKCESDILLMKNLKKIHGGVLTDLTKTIKWLENPPDNPTNV